MRTDQGPGMSGSGRRFRLAAVLAVGVAVGVAMMATPVSGHVGNSVSHLWNAQLKERTDARYYTKAQANARHLPAEGTAADAEQLDGLDSTQFVQGNGQAFGRAIDIVPPAIPNVVTIEGAFVLAYECLPNLANKGALIIESFPGNNMNLFVESGGAKPTYQVVGDPRPIVFPASATGDSFHIQANGTFGVATIEVATVHRESDCHVQAQVLITR